MKYIFLSKGKNRQLKADIIARSGAEIILNLCSGDNSSGEMWTTYDDVTNKMSFFNSISKERKSQYRVIDLGTHNIDLFIILWARIKGYIKLGVNYQWIESASIDATQDNFDDQFKDNSFENMASFRIRPRFMLLDGACDAKHMVNKANISLISMSCSLVSSPIGPLADLQSISGINMMAYKLSKEAELFGCNFGEFFNAMKELDVNAEIKMMLSNGAPSQRLLGIYGRENVQGTAVRLTGDNYVRFVSIRNGKEIVTVRMEDFLSATDLSLPILMTTIQEPKLFSSVHAGSAVLTINANGVISNKFGMVDFNPFMISLWNGKQGN